MTGSPETRQSLIARLGDHQDETAWQEFVDLYQPLILRMATRHGLQDADAAEITQEILLCVAQAVERWKPSGDSGSFRAWLFRIARNLLINYLTRQKRIELGSGDSEIRSMLENQPSASHPISAEFDLEYRRRMFRWAAERVRGKVQPETWQAFWKNSVEGKNANVVAAEMGVPTGKIYVARCRVMHRLKQEIERVSDSDSRYLGPPPPADSVADQSLNDDRLGDDRLGDDRLGDERLGEDCFGDDLLGGEWLGGDKPPAT